MDRSSFNKIESSVSKRLVHKREGGRFRTLRRRASERSEREVGKTSGEQPRAVHGQLGREDRSRLNP